MELETVLERVNNLIDDNSREHKAMLEQVLKTNGAVADLKKWKERMIGALVIMNIFIVPIIVAVVIDYIINYGK